MNRRSSIASLPLASILVATLALTSAVHAGLGDALKKKAAEAAAKKAEGAVAPPAAKPATPASEATPAKGGGDAGAGAAAGSGEKVSAVSTKFDYVPGDKVLFSDDLSQDELGEFPARWKLVGGTFEVAEMAGERWLRCVSVDGTVRMKLPAMAALPEFWTLEFDFYGEEPLSSGLTVKALAKGDHEIWNGVFPQGTEFAFRTGEVFSTTPFEGEVTGRHHVMFMARGTALKAYVDRQRMASVPEVSAEVGPAVTLEIRLWSPSKPMITNVRFAEGCRPAKDMLAEGKLVTYGIRFASGSDVVLPESAPVLRQISAYLVANPGVKLAITGHTDNVGGAASNLDLSKRRAASVARVLVEQFGIAADRLATDGKGDTQALAGNDKAEGRAMNRRVEFAKL